MQNELTISLNILIAFKCIQLYASFQDVAQEHRNRQQKVKSTPPKTFGLASPKAHVINEFLSTQSQKTFHSSGLDWFIPSLRNQSKSGDGTMLDTYKPIIAQLGNVSHDWPKKTLSMTGAFKIGTWTYRRRRLNKKKHYKLSS